jgi:hypothetical protein
MTTGSSGQWPHFATVDTEELGMGRQTLQLAMEPDRGRDQAAARGAMLRFGETFRSPHLSGRDRALPSLAGEPGCEIPQLNLHLNQ